MDGRAASGGDVPLEAGDQLVIPENVTKIAVFGQVAHSGIFPLRMEKKRPSPTRFLLPADSTSKRTNHRSALSGWWMENRR